MKASILSIVILFFLICCSEESNVLSSFEEMKFRKIAYMSLLPEEAATLTQDWRVAPVNQGEYKYDNNTHIIVFNKTNECHFGLSNEKNNP